MHACTSILDAPWIWFKIYIQVAHSKSYRMAQELGS